MKHEKPQKDPRLYDVRLSDISRRQKGLIMKFRNYGGSKVFRTREKEH